jgi:hypothetical protein
LTKSCKIWLFGKSGFDNLAKPGSGLGYLANPVLAIWQIRVPDWDNCQIRFWLFGKSGFRIGLFGKSGFRIGTIGKSGFGHLANPGSGLGYLANPEPGLDYLANPVLTIWQIAKKLYHYLANGQKIIPLFGHLQNLGAFDNF